MTEKNKWFESWFDSEFYHLLYKDRDQREAVFFIDNLLNFLQLNPSSSLLDLACGKGRHSIYLADKGYYVTGIDISENSINEAKRSEKENLHFFIQDMRTPFHGKKFDAVFNLFTSFGYFENETDDLKIISAIHDELNESGIFVIDFLNSVKTEKELIHHESKKIEGITFKIRRELKDGFFQKHISFTAHSKEYSFTEKVRNYNFSDLANILNATGLQINATFGDYSLSPFDERNSERLIIIAQKR